MFSKFAYAKAIPIYEKLIEEGSNNNHAYTRLAECYLLMRDFEESLPYFEKFIDNPTTSSAYFFKYAMALKTTGNSKKAEEYLKRYKKFNRNDPRVKKALKDGSLASVVFNSDERYEVEPVHFNTELSEFGTFVFDGKLYFASNRIGSQIDEENIYDWDGKPWLDIYQIQEGSPSARPEPFPGDINSKFHESSIVFTTNHKNDTIAYFTATVILKIKRLFTLKKVKKH